MLYEVITQVEQADLMRNNGWELWDSGKIDDAYISWRDSIALDPQHGQKAGPSVITSYSIHYTKLYEH